ncbi:MAG: response regulator [Candidatus Omnitrophica bacterium]|nr:response regulator [Candidatus Omnitrophota bacterium]
MKRILAVDDDFVSRVKLKNLLTPYGDCDAIPTGEMALEMVRYAHKEGVQYDLVTMDISMPGMTGIEVNEKIRDFEKKQGIPYSQGVKILMITVKKEMRDVKESYETGCEDYLCKPVTPEALEEVLRKMGIKKEV